eukprot:907158-Prorocentrum_minimum.AAC.1
MPQDTTIQRSCLPCSVIQVKRALVKGAFLVLATSAASSFSSRGADCAAPIPACTPAHPQRHTRTPAASH